METALVDAFRTLPQKQHITLERASAWAAAFLNIHGSKATCDSAIYNLTHFNESESAALVRDYLCKIRHPQFLLDYSTLNASMVIEQKLLMVAPHKFTPSQQRELRFRDALRSAFIDKMLGEGTVVQREDTIKASIKQFAHPECPWMTSSPNDVMHLNDKLFAVYYKMPTSISPSLLSEPSFAQVCRAQVICEVAEKSGHPLDGVIFAHYNIEDDTFCIQPHYPEPELQKHVVDAIKEGVNHVVHNTRPDTDWQYDQVASVYPQLNDRQIATARYLTFFKTLQDIAKKEADNAALSLTSDLSIPLDPNADKCRVSLGAVDVTSSTVTTVNQEKLLLMADDFGVKASDFEVDTKVIYNIDALLMAVRGKISEAGLDETIAMADVVTTSRKVQAGLTRKQSGIGSNLLRAYQEKTLETILDTHAKLEPKFENLDVIWTTPYKRHQQHDVSRAPLQSVLASSSRIPALEDVDFSKINPNLKQVQQQATGIKSTTSEQGEIASPSPAPRTQRRFRI